MKYFAKYLPVEGEIKDGSLYKTINGNVYQSKDGIAAELRKELGVKKFNEHFIHVKLFLCSKDIQVGDEVTVKWNDGKITTEKVQEFNYWLNSELVYKVMGEISPKATWVKEGDEFKGEGIDFVIAVSDEDYNKPPEKQKIFYLIKGPCGHFH